MITKVNTTKLDGRNKTKYLINQYRGKWSKFTISETEIFILDIRNECSEMLFKSCTLQI